MRMRKKKWAQPELNACQYFIKNPRDYKGNWINQFANIKPLYLEVGCGKGQFAANLACFNNDINLLAVDMISNMLGVARRNIERIYTENNRQIDNILITSHDVSQIDMMMDENDTVDRMFINFCNPWPRLKHNKRRLTHPRQLNKYKIFLKKHGQIHFKTDDDNLFNDSIDYFEQCGFDIIYLTRDLHNSDYKNNIITEHELMFSSEGITIKFLIAQNK